MKKVIEINDKVTSHISSISECIEKGNELVNGVSNEIKDMEAFTTSTQETSEKCVSLASELFSQSEQMKTSVEKFRL